MKKILFFSFALFMVVATACGDKKSSSSSSSSSSSDEEKTEKSEVSEVDQLIKEFEEAANNYVTSYQKVQNGDSDAEEAMEKADEKSQEIYNKLEKYQDKLTDEQKQKIQEIIQKVIDSRSQDTSIMLEADSSFSLDSYDDVPVEEVTINESDYDYYY